MKQRNPPNILRCDGCDATAAVDPREVEAAIAAPCGECGASEWVVTCGAENRQGQPCGRQVPKGRCRFHGGLSLRGPASPTYKTGRRSRFAPALPEGHRQLLERMMADDDGTELRELIAVTDAMIYEALRRHGTGTTLAPPVQRAQRHLDEALRAAARDDRDGSRAAFEALRQALRDAGDEAASRAELLRLMEQRRRLSDSETRNVVTKRLFLTPEQAATLAGEVAAASHAVVEWLAEQAGGRDDLKRRALSMLSERLTAIAERSAPAAAGDAAAGAEPAAN